MRTLQRPFVRRAAVVAAGAALAAAGCAPRAVSDSDARFTAPASAMAVACEPMQRAIVHPAVVNGAVMSQVECVTAVPTGAGAGGFQTVAYTPQGAAIPAALQTYEAPVAYAPARVVPATYSTYSAPAPRRVVSQPAQHYVPRHTTRSVKKSALIIGSSAGAGAGLGAVIGGKKGAAIGALVAGGGATLWDQITRHKQNQ
jgi:hypothetical protein